MGLSSSKSKTKNEPWAAAQPYILKNLAQQDAVFQSTQPQLEGFAGMQRDTYGRLAPGAEQGIRGSQGLVNDTLGGKYLREGNPYLEQILGQTRDSITDRVGSEFSGAGRYGSGMHTAVLGKQLADAENQARFGVYDRERDRQTEAVGQAGGLMNGATGLLNNAAELPWLGVQASNGAVRQASGGYGTQTTKSSPSLWSGIMEGVGTAAKAASMFSDERLKTDEKKIGEREDGLGVYSYRYKGDDAPQIGVMAQEVERERPDALGPEVGGFKTVNYGALGMDTPEIGKPVTNVPKGLFGAPRIKPGFNDPGGLGGKLGEFGDFLLAGQGNPAAIQSLRARQEQQGAANDEQTYQRRRQEGMEDWRYKEDYERANPTPPNNDTVADYRFILDTLGPDAARKFLQTKTLPPPFVQRNPDGTSTIYPQGLPRDGGPPPAPVGKLKPYGGAGQGGPRTFP